ncbi:ferredoxin reductase [Aquirhabdus parva]|nr:ferredoxin reductase [Aquirhabdus parva]
MKAPAAANCTWQAKGNDMQATLTSSTNYQPAAYKPHWVREDFVDFVLAKINPLWTVTRTMARVENIEYIEDDMVKVTLSTNHLLNRRFKTFKAGQFIMLTVTIAGVRHQRAYSLVNTPENYAKTGRLVIGVKRQGRVSNYLAKQAKIGDVLEIAPASGEFMLTEEATPALFISAGSGITPIVPMIQQALERSKLPVTLIYYSRDPAFRMELETLAAAYPQFDLNIIVDSAEKPAFFDVETLERICPDAATRETYVCAAPGLMTATRKIWESFGWSDKMRQESFLPIKVDENAEAQLVNFRRSQREFEAKGNLLASAEAAGLTPTYGCRMGVCNACVCTKVSGSVRNQVTGEINDQNNVQIKLCVNAAISEVVIDL